MAAKKKGKKKKPQVYLVLSQRGNRLFGAFPYSEEGLVNAEKYVRKITRQHKEKFRIEPS
jgi:hypothetical protein